MDADAGPVALAVITCNGLVLVGRRADGNPPWVFPGGKIEPGESPEDAAVRETLEETGLRVRATGVIGSRVHPRTGVVIIYVCGESSAHSGDIAQVGAELTEVQWVRLAQADHLMGGAIYQPVRDYIAGVEQSW